MKHRRPTIPPERCPHKVPARIVVDDDGWEIPQAPDGCDLCQETDWTGIPFKRGGGRPPDQSTARRVTVECPKPGCVVMIERGKPHKTPCLNPDTVAVHYPRPVSVEIDQSRRWHSPREWNEQTGYYTVSFCGRRGRPTDQSDDDLVDCKSCLGRR